MASPEIEWDIKTYDDTNPTEVWKDVFSGTVGGIAQVLVGQPFDTTKVRLQSAPEGTYTGAMDVVRRLIKNEGLKGFYKGTTTPLVGVGACVSVQFAVNEGVKRFFTDRNKKAGHVNPKDLGYGELYASGAAAGFSNSFLASPIEQVRIRLQTQTGAPGSLVLNGPIDAFKKIYHAGGISGIFRGLSPTIIRESHGMAMYFLGAEALVKRDMRVNNVARGDIPSWRMCAYGGVAGIVMWLTIYPIDVIKSKMQTDSIFPAKRTFKTMRQCLFDTCRLGPAALFKGFTPTLLRAAPVNAATFVAFEATRRYLG